ncbi:MAG: vitamin B12-dependent ribonucleotide reductase [Acidimicrobiales bacterium]
MAPESRTAAEERPVGAGTGIARHFTTPGVDPYAEVDWARRDSRIVNHRDGTVAFEQRGVEVPVTWSLNATNILAQKYFRGAPGSPEREHSLKQVADRVVDTITAWGRADGYFADEAEASAFAAELKYLVVTQRAAFNSPVWFNIGAPGRRQQASACFILSVEDTMGSILNWYVEEGMIFKGGSGSGTNLSRIRSSAEPLTGGGTASGPVSFMRGADASAGTIKSGGSTRRAAKMVILDADHPDIEDFIWCKAVEERKARALRAAGFDMDLDGRDSYSIQYQNANNSVRVTDEFMQAVLDGADWHLRAVTTGEVVKTLKARALLRQMSEATWECADPGIQFDTTINRWHTAANSGRINASNPCSEYVHLDDSACNLASINLLRFLDEESDGFDVGSFCHAVEVVFTAQEILIGNADYPTEPIAETSRRFRQLGIGYANLGALLMALGLPYDSDQGRAWAACLTALLTGHAYATSVRTAARMGPFAGYADNAEHMLGVLRMHRDAVAHIDEELVPPDVLGAAQRAWDHAVTGSETYGVRNSQASVLAPTGTIGLLMDCDTTGIEPDLGLCKMKKLVGGGTMTIVNQTVPRALRRLGYTSQQVEEIVAHIDRNKTILGAPHLATEHIPVFACSMGDNPIHYEGHVRMMGAVQPFISGAISKCVAGETVLTTADGLVRIGSLHRGEPPDTFRDEVLEVASLEGPQKTDAFYYGGTRPVRRVVLRSGHAVVGTSNHRLLVAVGSGLAWRRLDEVERDDMVAVRYGADLWSSLPARFDDFRPADRHGCQAAVRVPAEMTAELAFLLGAYASGGHVDRSRQTVRISSSVPAALERVVDAWRDLFGIDAQLIDDGRRRPGVVAASETVVELLDHLGCGDRAPAKRVPDAVLRSPRDMVVAFLEGLALDARPTTSPAPRWGIRLASPGLLDDLQTVLTNLGIVHGRVRGRRARHDQALGEVYATGGHARRLAALVPFPERDRAARDAELTGLPGDVAPDVVPDAVPDAVPGVALPRWLGQVPDDGLHFSPVESVDDAGEREVFDVSVPRTRAFVGNGIVNHNTVNMPADVTVEDVEQLHINAWKLGLKAIAIYRDSCKVAQPLSMATKEAPPATPPSAVGGPVPAPVAARIAETVAAQAGPERQKLPRNRRSRTFEFRVADCKGFVTVGEYDDGRPGELFLRVSKQGSTLAGIMDAFAISVSHGLQYGVPLGAFVEAFTNIRFEPAGMTDDPDIRFATSLVDYIFRRLAVDYLPLEQRMDLGILSVGERTQPALPGLEEAATETAAGLDLVPSPPGEDTRSADLDPLVGLALPGRSARPGPASADAPYCMQCGVQMIRAGSCHACPSCGTTSGCS